MIYEGAMVLSPSSSAPSDSDSKIRIGHSKPKEPWYSSAELEFHIAPDYESYYTIFLNLLRALPRGGGMHATYEAFHTIKIRQYAKKSSLTDRQFHEMKRTGQKRTGEKAAKESEGALYQVIWSIIANDIHFEGIDFDIDQVEGSWLTSAIEWIKSLQSCVANARRSGEPLRIQL